MSCDLIKLRTTIFNGLLSLLLATLTFCPILVYADSVDRDTLFIDSLKVRFNLDDPVIKSGVIDFYIDSIGVASNDFLKFITLVATPYDFSKPQIKRIFDTASVQYNETRILTYLKYFNDKSYVPLVKEWFKKSDKRGKNLYESILFEFGDKEIADQILQKNKFFATFLFHRRKILLMCCSYTGKDADGWLNDTFQCGHFSFFRDCRFEDRNFCLFP
mgnify:CR=1 FL=1